MIFLLVSYFTHFTIKLIDFIFLDIRFIVKVNLLMFSHVVLTRCDDVFSFFFFLLPILFFVCPSMKHPIPSFFPPLLLQEERRMTFAVAYEKACLIFW